jgi:hypothetical protein
MKTIKPLKTIKTMKTMKKLTLLLLTIFAFSSNYTFSQALDAAKKPAIVFQEDGSGNVHSGKIYASTARGASRGQNGDPGAAWGNQGDWSVDLTVTEKFSDNAYADYGGNAALNGINWGPLTTASPPTHGGFGAVSRASFVAGNYNRAHGIGAVALGFVNVAGNEAGLTAGGPFNDVGLGMGVGTGVQDSNIGQFAVGWRNLAYGNGAVAMGHGTKALGAWSLSHGNTTKASGSGSVALGILTTADTGGCLAIGVNNTVITDATATTPNYYNYYNDTKGGFGMAAPARAFVIGNGSLQTDGTKLLGAGTKSDAFTVFYDGTTVIAGDLTVNSDMRLKSNIVSLGSTLSKLMQLDGKSYNMNGDDSKKKIGLLAQNVQEVFPELVKTGTDALGTLSVNYQGLIPILINSIKELQAEVLALKNKK